MIDRALAFFFANQWLVFALVGLILLAVAEIGFRAGLRLHAAKDEPRKGQIGGIQGAVLGLLALLLGFTFAMAVGRYDTRRLLVLSEANAIGTTYLRAALLPAPQHAAIENLLRQYVDARLAFHDAGADLDKRKAVETKTAQLQRELWAQTVEASKTPTPVTATFITALNETIDLDSTQLQAIRSRVPGVVWLLLLVVASAGCFASGYGAGASGARSKFANALLPLLITIVITLISDLDRPYKGLIELDRRPLLELKASLIPKGNEN
jgi:hypothetical protein